MVAGGSTERTSQVRGLLLPMQQKSKSLPHPLPRAHTHAHRNERQVREKRRSTRTHPRMIIAIITRRTPRAGERQCPRAAAKAHSIDPPAADPPLYNSNPNTTLTAKRFLTVPLVTCWSKTRRCDTHRERASARDRAAAKSEGLLAPARLLPSPLSLARARDSDARLRLSIPSLDLTP